MTPDGGPGFVQFVPGTEPPSDEDFADAILAAGYRKGGEPEPRTETNNGIRTEVDAFGGVTTIYPPDVVRAQDRIRTMLEPDHNCTGAGGMGTMTDGSHYTYSRPCQGCVRQRERVMRELAAPASRLTPDEGQSDG